MCLIKCLMIRQLANERSHRHFKIKFSNYEVKIKFCLLFNFKIFHTNRDRKIKKNETEMRKNVDFLSLAFSKASLIFYLPVSIYLAVPTTNISVWVY